MAIQHQPQLVAAGAAIPGLLNLPEPVAHLLLQASQRRKLSRGEPLFAYGSAPDAMFGMVTGAVRTSITSASGREFVLGLLQAGHWFGEVSLLDGLPRVYAAHAVGDCEVAVLPAATFWPLAAKHPEVHLALTRLVCHRLRLALAWIDDTVLMPLPARLARRITALLQGGGASGDSGVVPLSQEDLAAQLGVSRQSINRQLKLWEKQGLLRIDYGRIAVFDRAALAQLAQR
ncbi:Crp/Fnr family transcriptional regulator [Polaromonas sp. SM01]|uniref:Crp/Fnr family transcriptional regulator n=1 Tax=Polaromonas sp. SM01 TaxID=3085630 RepID=UPI00298254AC|nr:Crp/Fnr family transcriptional regulator [Polaromonas sp. SM01]MDW5441155.1 Crp/Fnr family transcriptional regulator [Polaromonas sp. SM01]